MRERARAIRFRSTPGDTWGGASQLTFCPGKCDPNVQTGASDRDLDSDLRAVLDQGPSTFVTLMEMHELELLPIPNLGERVSRTGLRWWHLPIVDGGVPDARFGHAWIGAGADLRRRLLAGEGIVVHRRGGLARTGIVAVKLLIDFGEEPESALFRVHRARTGTVENRLQERYVCGLLEVRGIFKTYSVQNTIGRSKPRAKSSAEHGLDGPCWPRLPESM